MTCRRWELEIVPQWGVGYRWCAYLRVGQSAHIWRMGPFVIYWLVIHGEEEGC